MCSDRFYELMEEVTYKTPVWRLGNHDFTYLWRGLYEKYWTILSIYLICIP